MARKKTGRGGSKGGGKDWTAETLADRRTLIRRFEINLPDILPRADWPHPPRPDGDLNDSDLLFQNLILLRSWPPHGRAGSPPEFPLDLLGESRPPDDDRARQFVDALLWGVEGSRPDLLEGFPDLGIFGFRELRRELWDRGFSPLTEYRVCLASQYAIRHLDSTVFTLDLVRSLKRQHSGSEARKKAGFDRLVRTGQLIDGFKKLWDLDAPAPEELQAAEPRSGTELDTHGLPDDMLWVPPSIRRLALAVLAIPEGDLNPELARTKKDDGFSRLREEHRGETAGHFEPDDPQTRDPAAMALIRALDVVLVREIPGPRKRAEFVALFLDALYPKGYRSRANPLGPQGPSGHWDPRDVSRVAGKPPRAPRMSEGEAEDHL